MRKTILSCNFRTYSILLFYFIIWLWSLHLSCIRRGKNQHKQAYNEVFLSIPKSLLYSRKDVDTMRFNKGVIKGNLTSPTWVELIDDELDLSIVVGVPVLAVAAENLLDTLGKRVFCNFWPVTIKKLIRATPAVSWWKGEHNSWCQNVGKDVYTDKSLLIHRKCDVHKMKI